MGESIISYDPRDGHVNGEVAATPADQLPEVMARAQAAFQQWGPLSHQERRPYLKAFKREVLGRADEIARLVSAESGKSLEDALSLDVLTSLTVMDHYCRKAGVYLADRRAGWWPFFTTHSINRFRPRGVAAVITPWNYPFFLPMISLFSAVAAGCSVVLKPSELTPLTGRLFVELATAAGLPPDLVQVVQGGGELGAALVAAGPDVIAFTGSTAVGRKVALEAARTMTPVILELGSCDPVIVLEDADLRQAARATAWGACVNAGQTCVSVERVYVVDAVYDQFMEELEGAFDAVTAGTGDRRDIGPITLPTQIEVIERHVGDALRRGARARRGGHRVEAGGGIYYAPTILEEVDHSMEIVAEETFGPVAPVIRVRDEEEAVALANDCRFGLHASVWTRNRKRGMGVATRLKAGTVAVNDVTINFITPGATFGGVGDSGLGSALGPEGIRAYCHPQGIAVSRLRWPTSALLGARFPRRRGRRYWKALAHLLYRW